MITPAALSPTIFTTFSLRENDGVDFESMCDGHRHIEFVDGAVSRINPCDGSCRSNRYIVDLNDLIVKASEERIMVSRRRSLTSDTKLDTTMRKLVEASDPLVGVKFRSRYARRTGETMHVCLGDTHVAVKTAFTWQDGRKGKKAEAVYKTHSLSAAPCDGSCKKTLTATPELLDNIERLERDGW